MKLICSLFELSLVRTFFWDFKKPLLLQFIHKKNRIFWFSLADVWKQRIQLTTVFFNFNHNGFVKIGKIIVKQKFQWNIFAKFYSKTANSTIQIRKP